MGLQSSGRWIRRGLSGSLGVWILSAAVAWGAELQNWRFDPERSELSFTLTDTIYPEFSSLSDPQRLVVDIPETEVGNLAAEQRYDGLVRRVRISQFAPDQVRVVMDLAPGVALTSEQADVEFKSAQGLRHWRIRPIATETDGLALTPTNSGSVLGAELKPAGSAADLQLRPEAATEDLPLDPYDLENTAGTEVVRVPDLAPALQTSAAAVEIPVIAAPTAPAVPELTPLEPLEGGTEAGTPAEVPIVEAVPAPTAAPSADIVVAAPTAASAPAPPAPAIETVQQPTAGHGRTITATPPPAITFGQPLPSRP